MDKLISAVQEALPLLPRKRSPARELRCEMNPKNGISRPLQVDRVTESFPSTTSFAQRGRRTKRCATGRRGRSGSDAGILGGSHPYAKQSLLQHIRRAEKQLIFAESRTGWAIVHGVVRGSRNRTSRWTGPYDALLPTRTVPPRIPNWRTDPVLRQRCHRKWSACPESSCRARIQSSSSSSSN